MTDIGPYAGINASRTFRAHSSIIPVNINHIKKFRKGESSVAIMSNTDVVKVSRLNKDKLAQRLGVK
ncbi:hypothetical protein HK413_06540 [Mucilaginibacter sp. S1162]|uniref:HTH LytTR-type domain-containing protein n=1 Tax=Mucilaginibacter humi TaxID=2732510 RepID=A0ABX1W5L5_9SPHI|nr:hypothetical protein [Mucilaginibacter humi]